MSARRYEAQLCLPEVGVTGQKALMAAQIIVIGAGGLGSTLLPLLVGAGIGHIHIMDDDVVEEHNLHRQTLYRMADIGRSKAEVAAEHLRALNPYVTITPHSIGAQANTVLPVLESCLANIEEEGRVLVIDAADNFAATYMVSDLCQRHSVCLISGSSIRWTGYAGIFCHEAPSYRAVFPEMSQNAQDCRTAGVLGPVVGMIGTLQAQLCLSLLLGVTPSPVGKLYRWDAQALRMSAFDFRSAEEPQASWPFLSLSQVQSDDVLVDVRVPGEQPQFTRRDIYNLPLDQFMRIEEWTLPHDARIVLCCQTGLRATRAAAFLRGKGYKNLALLAVRHQGTL